MKKILCLILSLVLLGAFVLPAGAEEEVSQDKPPVLTVGSDKVLPGGTVTVEVSLSENPGFTNFAIALSWQSSALTLTALKPAAQDGELLQNCRVSTNTQWKDSSDAVLGYVVAASAAPVTDDGVVFTATFQASADFTGEAQLIPQVMYLRSRGEDAQTAVVSSGTMEALVPGDVTGDKVVEYDDVMLAYRAAKGLETLTPYQILAADTNNNGVVDNEEVEAVYRIYTWRPMT